MKGKLNKEQQDLVVAHIGYSLRIAQQLYREHQKAGVEFCDYEGAALLGLCDAALRYDPEKGKLFKSFASFRIRGAIIDMLRRIGILPRAAFDQRHSQDLVLANSAKEVAAICESTEELGIRVHISHDQEVSGISYARDTNPEQELVENDQRVYLKRLIDQLPDREHELIELRFQQDFTISALQKHFGRYSKSWVSRLQASAIQGLRAGSRRYERIAARQRAEYCHAA